MSFSLDDTLVWLVDRKWGTTWRRCWWKWLKQELWQGNNYKILLLVIISTIQPQYQSTICYSIAIHLYECHLLKQVPEEPIIIFKWGERTQFHCCTTLLTPVQSFSWLIYFHEKESMYFKLLDQVPWDT